MARTTIVAQALLGPYPSLPLTADSADIVFANSDNANGNQVVSTGKEIVLVRNNSGGAAGTVTITSTVDELNRTGHITAYSLANGDIAMLGPFSEKGWKQSDGYLYIDTSAATMQLKVVKIP